MKTGMKRSIFGRPIVSLTAGTDTSELTIDRICLTVDETSTNG